MQQGKKIHELEIAKMDQDLNNNAKGIEDMASALNELTNANIGTVDISLDRSIVISTTLESAKTLFYFQMA